MNVVVHVCSWLSALWGNIFIKTMVIKLGGVQILRRMKKKRWRNQGHFAIRRVSDETDTDNV